jgi:hypothetical protein
MELSTNKIKRNAAHCLSCNKIIESKHTHDFVYCECENIFVDGGKAYIRRGIKNPSMYIDLSEFDNNKE